MAREMISEMDVDKVVGGSIVFNGDHTTCGRDCNDQYKANTYSAVIQYIAENRHNMSEKKMLSNMVEQGLLTSL